ncbi:nickel pincer cofactor biosynthesis protein LarC [Actinoplanes sp. CA-142083]|uniref:nickel pincer cofactor biosynthesis protein LarC n=1 Tax=Actinoplanes sp. CA-142083 TaxID=3239903 RepID=UPI003D90E9FA
MTERHAWIDASAGVAGDMLLGALLDAGASLAAVRAAVSAVADRTAADITDVSDADQTAADTTDARNADRAAAAVAGPGPSVWVSLRPVTRAGLRALKVDVQALAGQPPARTWQDVRAMLGRASLPEPVRRNAVAVFKTLAEAEARVHGVSPDEVHFHEVGAFDAIADVVGCCAALDDLGITTVSAGPVALGSGSVRTQHGRLPVPAPAVAELAKGWQVSAGGDGELATPTGMALLRTFAGVCEPLPPMVLDTVGVGAGGRDPAGNANVVRVMIGSRVEKAAAVQMSTGARTTGSAHEAAETLVLLEANVDDLDPRLWPGVLEGLLELGAADAWLTPILMKKGRPAHLLSVLGRAGNADALRERIFRDTSTLGVRHSTRGRVALERGFVEVPIGEDRVTVKVGHREGVLVQVMPEFGDVAALARRTGRPERLVLQEAMTAAAAEGLVVGAAVPDELKD